MERKFPSIRSVESVCHETCRMGRPNDHILTAELHRIAVRNTDINIMIGGRSIMLRIPFSFDLHPIDRFRTAEDLYKLTLQGAKR